MDNITQLIENFIAILLQPSGTRCGKLVLISLMGLFGFFKMKQKEVNKNKDERLFSFDVHSLRSFDDQ